MSVTGPVTNVWQTDLIAAQALSVLRIDQSDIDSDRVEADASVATVLIDDAIDGVEPLTIPDGSPLHNAALQVTVELYRRADVVGDEPLFGVAGLIATSKMRWGIA